jgi:dTDP-L-rhamnose 4-epimerase
VNGRGTCLVTGGAGFIGCALGVGLLERFDRVIAFDSLHPQVHRSRKRPRALPKEIALVVGDVSDPVALDAVLSQTRPIAIIHLAAETGTGQSLTEAVRHSNVNVMGTAQILEALTRAEHFPREILLTSSRACYGEGFWRAADGRLVNPAPRSPDQLSGQEWDFAGLVPVPSAAQQTPANPVSIYGATKLAQENILKCWAVARGIDLKIARLQNVYGPGQSLINSYTGIVSLFCQIARSNKSIPLYEDGAMMRDFIHVSDVAVALLALVDAVAPPGMILDIGSGIPTTISTLASHIATHYGAPPPHISGAYRLGDVRHAFADISVAKRTLGWAPAHELADGLLTLIGWIEDELRDRIEP